MTPGTESLIRKREDKLSLFRLWIVLKRKLILIFWAFLLCVPSLGTHGACPYVRLRAEPIIPTAAGVAPPIEDR